MTRQSANVGPLSLLSGVIAGAIVATAGAFGILETNARTMTPASGAVVVAIWALLGAGVGLAGGWLGGRTAAILRRPAAVGTIVFATLVTGHLFLPVGFGVVLAVLVLILLSLRRVLFPRARRVDPVFLLGLASFVPPAIEATMPALPPPFDASTPLASGSVAPGSVPVTISVTRAAEFPAVAAAHFDLRALQSAAAGVDAALWTGRLPLRTRAGDLSPVKLPGGGGLSRAWDAPGVQLLLRVLPAVDDPRAEPFALAGTLPAIAEASGLAVLRDLPSDNEPSHYLRVLESRGPLPDDVARELQRRGAWIDVHLDDEGGGRVALSGVGMRVGRFPGHVALVDVAPTVLHLLGLAIPRGVDGRVITEAIDGDGPGARAFRYRALPEDASTSDATTSR